ncbi:hypothetical protein B0H19DRAFT_1365106 [Mycena capillaripes]|nr:hypothetical protein B0H19DRAFT_1365106 [Mycena capillaripes]
MDDIRKNRSPINATSRGQIKFRDPEITRLLTSARAQALELLLFCLLVPFLATPALASARAGPSRDSPRPPSRSSPASPPARTRSTPASTCTPRPPTLPMPTWRSSETTVVQLTQCEKALMPGGKAAQCEGARGGCDDEHDLRPRSGEDMDGDPAVAHRVLLNTPTGNGNGKARRAQLDSIPEEGEGEPAYLSSAYPHTAHPRRRPAAPTKPASPPMLLAALIRQWLTAGLALALCPLYVVLLLVRGPSEVLVGGGGV